MTILFICHSDHVRWSHRTCSITSYKNDNFVTRFVFCDFSLILLKFESELNEHISITSFEKKKKKTIRIKATHSEYGMKLYEYSMVTLSFAGIDILQIDRSNIIRNCMVFWLSILSINRTQRKCLMFTITASETFSLLFV